jgi:hypothetical protein
VENFMNERFATLVDICRRFGVAVLYVFGSCAIYDLYLLRRAGDLAFLERERMALVLGGST